MAYRLNPLRKFVEGNVTIIVNKTDVMLVDGGGGTTSAKNIIDLVQKITKNPIRYIINSHPHGDHTLGNFEYARAFPGVEIISTSYTRNEIVNNLNSYIKSFDTAFDGIRKSELKLIDTAVAEQKPGYKEVVKYLSKYTDEDIYIRRHEYSTLSVYPPTLICDQKITLYRDGRTIEIMHIGKGDTPGDMIVYLPNQKVVCSGDMVVNPFPYGFSKDPQAWIKTLKKLDSLNFDFLVPGHGDLQKGKTYLDDVIKLLQSVQEQVKAGIANGLTLIQIKDQVNLRAFTDKYLPNDPIYRYRFDRWFFNPAVERAYQIYASKNP